MTVDDASWAAIERAALPYRPNDAARAALGAALAEFAGLVRDPDDIRRERERWPRLCEPIKALHPELKRLYLDIAKGLAQAGKRKGGRARRSVASHASSLLGLLFALEVFALHAETNMRGLEVWAKAYRRQQDPARETLYWRLFEIWTRDFGGELTTSTVDEPGGALIRFLQATTPLALGILPSPHTFKDAVTREQERRAIDREMRKRIERRDAARRGPTPEQTT